MKTFHVSLKRQKIKRKLGQEVVEYMFEGEVAGDRIGCLVDACKNTPMTVVQSDAKIALKIQIKKKVSSPFEIQF